MSYAVTFGHARRVLNTNFAYVDERLHGIIRPRFLLEE